MILSACANIGFFQIVFPTVLVPQLTNIIGAFLLIVSYTIPSVSVLFCSPKSKMVGKITCLMFASGVFIASNFYVFFLLGLVLASLVSLVAGAFKRHLNLFLLGTLQVLCVLKVLNVPHMPAGTTIYYFFGFLAIRKLLLRLRVTSNFSRLVSFVSKMDTSPELATRNIASVVGLAQNLTSLRSLTLLHVQIDSKIKIVQFKKDQNLFFVDAVPPIFAHAMSLKREIWHLKVGSPEFHRIKKVGKTNFEMGEYISVLPIYDDEKMYGAVAISGYASTVVATQEYNIEQKAILRVVVETLRSLIKKEESFQKSFWNELFINSHSIISELAISSVQTEYPLAEVASEISRILDASVFIAELDQVTRKFSMKGIHGFEAFVQERFMKGTVYANLDNEQGPIALAVNRKQAVIVSDVQLLKDVLHENSVQFFAKNNTLSCAGIPIFYVGTNDIWGVLWLERRKSLLPFDLLSEGPLTGLAAAVSLYIDRRGKDQSILAANSTLHSFIPEDVFEDVINNGKVREDDHGYLLMLDLKGSTKVSLEKGSDFWLNEAAKIKEPLTKIGENFGLKLREYKWDAFVFSMTSNEVSREQVNRIEQFCREASQLIEGWYNESFVSVSDENREKNQKARFCITFGDISRGLTQGTVKAWGMIGAEIAAVTKMEDYCKKLAGVVFFDESVHVNDVKSTLIDCDTIVASTHRKIFRSADSWAEMVHNFKNAA